VDRSIGSPRTRSVVGVRGPGVSVFELPAVEGNIGAKISLGKFFLVTTAILSFNIYSR